MANCSNCSAPLLPDTIRCEYCGSRNDVDLKGIHYYTTHETESERACPRCSISLQTIDLKINGRFFIERCNQCLGLFFDPGELDALLDAAVTNVFVIDRGRLEQIGSSGPSASYPVGYIKCPVCSKVMNRVNFGARSGVIVDVCKDHGVWLDGGELRQLFEWMKAGGKLLDQERREQRRKDEEHEQHRRQPQAPVGTASDFDSVGGILKQQDPDLLDLLVAAVRFFTK